jgi:hypothetical protein
MRWSSAIPDLRLTATVPDHRGFSTTEKNVNSHNGIKTRTLTYEQPPLLAVWPHACSLYIPLAACYHTYLRISHHVALLGRPQVGRGRANTGFCGCGTDGDCGKGQSEGCLMPEISKRVRFAPQFSMVAPVVTLRLTAGTAMRNSPAIGYVATLESAVYVKTLEGASARRPVSSLFQPRARANRSHPGSRPHTCATAWRSTKPSVQRHQACSAKLRKPSEHHTLVPRGTGIGTALPRCVPAAAPAGRTASGQL